MALPVTLAAERPGDIRHSLADIAQAQTWLGFQPAVSIAAGLRQTLAWFRQEAREVS